MSNPKGSPQNLAPRWKPGQSGNPRGRKPGILDGADLLKIALQALDKLGGQNWLKEQGEKHPADFLRFLARAIPSKLQLDATVTFSHHLAALEQAAKQAKETPGETEKGNTG